MAFAELPRELAGERSLLLGVEEVVITCEAGGQLDFQEVPELRTPSLCFDREVKVHARQSTTGALGLVRIWEGEGRLVKTARKGRSGGRALILVL